MDYKEINGKRIYLKLTLQSMGYITTKGYYYNILLKTGEIIGNCCLRDEINENNYYMGNIEYKIKPEYQNLGYATEATKLILELAKKLGLKKVYVSCVKENIASQQVIKNSKGVLIEYAPVPLNNKLNKYGVDKVLIYKINLEEDNGRSR